MRNERMPVVQSSPVPSRRKTQRSFIWSSETKKVARSPSGKIPPSFNPHDLYSRFPNRWYLRISTGFFFSASWPGPRGGAEAEKVGSCAYRRGGGRFLRGAMGYGGIGCGQVCARYDWVGDSEFGGMREIEADTGCPRSKVLGITNNLSVLQKIDDLSSDSSEGIWSLSIRQESRECVPGWLLFLRRS